MKIPKKLKKVDSRVIQALVMLVIIGFFIYVFYHSYQLFRRYQEMKTGEDKRPVERLPVEPPQLFNFSPDAESEDIERYQLFSFEKKKIEKLPSLSGGSGTVGSGNYRILGVVKRNQLFLLVRFNSNDKIGLFAEGTEIDNGSRVEKLTVDQVIIADPSGQQNTYKIFQKKYQYTTTGNDAVVSPKRVPVGRNEMDDEPLNSTRKQEKKVEDEENPGKKEMIAVEDQPLDEKKPKRKEKAYKKKDKEK
ncbi:MAG: hypothetical protein PVH61_31440 [Candidatus Aminicenantes bacterium]|jgi:hypothetical protein